MGHSLSPQRRRWVTEPEEIEPRPEAFAVLPHYSPEGEITLFRVEDPEGAVIRKRGDLIAAIHKEYPSVSIEQLQNAHISYYDYFATVALKS